jgi:RNA polymerase sigma-70 factor (ECF subfamily)
MISTPPCDETLAVRRRQLLRTLFGELPEAQGEAMVLRLALGYAIEEIALISNTPVPVVRSRLRLAKEALRARIEADPSWDTVWGDEG